jgi:hypothetical protein
MQLMQRGCEIQERVCRGNSARKWARICERICERIWGGGAVNRDVNERVNEHVNVVAKWGQIYQIMFQAV